MTDSMTTELGRWTRLELPDPEAMAADQRGIYDRAVEFFGGPYGPRMPLLFSPDLDTVWTAFGEALKVSELSPAARELTILTTARWWDAQFEWQAHEVKGRAAGLGDEVIEAVRAGRRPVAEEPWIGAIFDYVSELLGRHSIRDATYARLLSLIGPEQLVEMTVLVGYYGNVAISLAAHAAPLPPGVEAPLPPRTGAGDVRPVREFLATADDGAHLQVRCDGDPAAPALLLSNSLGTDLTMWEPQIAPLADRFCVIRYDSRGHGRSDVTPAPYTTERLGRDALAVLDAAGIERAAVCGVSQGGMVAQWLAINAPRRVEAAVIANSAAYIGGPDAVRERIEAVRAGGPASLVEAIVERWFRPEFVAREPRQVEAIKRVFCATPTEGYLGCCAALGDLDLREGLARIEAPTLVIAGDADPAGPLSASEAIVAAVPGAELLVLPAAHLSNVEQADRFTAAVIGLAG
ncbi:MAG: 3-oxoadipate enol-lactonase [Solirubrobacterales bacterium]